MPRILEIEKYHPYSGGCLGPGRWYNCYLNPEEVVGYVWTDDRQGFGMIITSPSYDAQTALDWFLYCRNVWGRQGTSATDAFESFHQMQAVWSSEVAPLESGDLKVKLRERAEQDMTETGYYIEYGVTVDGTGNILELIRHDPSGTFLRESRKWVAIDGDADTSAYPTIYDQEWVEVAETILDYFDQNADSNDLTVADIDMHVV